jgi:outer membrane protein OmpA-like peptidoglycan-associated protein
MSGNQGSAYSKALRQGYGRLAAMLVAAGGMACHVDASNEAPLPGTQQASVSAGLCEVKPPTPSSFAPEVEWEWKGNPSVLPDHKQVMTTPLVLELNGDGIPDVVFSAYVANSWTSDGVLRAISGADGSDLWTATDPASRVRGAATLAAGDIDHDGKPELCTIPEDGKGFICFEHDGTFKFRTDTPAHVWGGVSFADLDHDGNVEILDGNHVFSNTGELKWIGSDGIGGIPGVGPISFAADIDGDGLQEVINDRAVYNADGSLKCANTDIGHGLAGVGNFDADDKGEIVVVWSGKVSLLDDDCTLLWTSSIPGGGTGGAPNVADFDNDGQAEIGVAGAVRYSVFETNGTVKWSSPTQDGSSQVTGSSTFDFEGDGRAEAVYADEVSLRIYDGATGAIRFQVPHSTCTAYENPVIADVDGDNNAEIVAAANVSCGFGPFAGIRVFRDGRDGWVNARKMWNQHAYSVTNVNDDATIPASPVANWRTPGLNTFRANSQGSGTTSAFAAADLIASEVTGACDSGAQELTLSARITNQGEASASAGLQVAFFQGNPASGGTQLGVATLPSVLAAGASTVASLTLSPAPSGIADGVADIYVVADFGPDTGRELECREDNNVASAPESCVRLKDLGEGCGASTECASGACADGVCCNTACDGQCEACDETGSEGTCTAVTGAPRGERPACDSDGSVCGGVCDGTGRAACTYPSAAVQCGTPGCSEGVATVSATCNGAGSCLVQTQQCELYTCGENACRTGCTSDAECSADGICLGGECRPRGDRSLWKVEGSGCSSTGSGGALLWPLVLGVLARFSRRRRNAAPALLAATAVLAVPAAASAQPDDVSRSFQLERFQPQPGRADVLGVQSARVGEHLAFSARLFADYAHQPLRLVSTVDDRFQHIMVSNQSHFTLTAALALKERFELGLSVPVLLHQATEGAALVDSRLGGRVSSAAFSELRLSTKAVLVRAENYGLALSLPVTLPTAPADSYVGGSSLTFNPTVVGELAGPRGSRVMLNAGLLLERSRQFLNLHLGPAFTYGVGGKVDLVPRWNLAFLSTLSGQVGLSQPSAETSPLELLLALRWGFIRDMEMTLGAGPGLTNGYGTPRYRLLAALSYVPGARSTPARPAPVAHPVPPPPPTTPAPPPMPAPPPLVARDDETRVQAGQSVSLNVLGNDEGQRGEALRLVEVTSATGGQVELAPDGTVHYTAREGFSGREELTYRVVGEGGRVATGTLVVNVEAPPPPPPPAPAPSPAPAAVVVEKGKIRALDKVLFATNKDEVLPESLHILDDVFHLMSTDATIRKVRIEAHTDNKGSAAYNQDLSERRAKWVREYLVKKGIDPVRLDSKGFGPSRPIDTNDTPEGRGNNRRVEFVIVE